MMKVTPLTPIASSVVPEKLLARRKRRRLCTVVSWLLVVLPLVVVSTTGKRASIILTAAVAHPVDQGDVAGGGSDGGSGGSGEQSAHNEHRYYHPLAEEPTTAAIDSKEGNNNNNNNYSDPPARSPSRVDSNHDDVADNERPQNGNNSSSRSSSSNQPTTTHDPLEEMRHVLVIFAVGVAMIVTLLVVVYMVALLFDKLPCCQNSRANRLRRHELAMQHRYHQQAILSRLSFLDRGAVSRKAHLWGLTRAERMQILPTVFRHTTFMWNEPPVLESLSTTTPEQLPSTLTSPPKQESQPDDVVTTGENRDLADKDGCPEKDAMPAEEEEELSPPTNSATPETDENRQAQQRQKQEEQQRQDEQQPPQQQNGKQLETQETHIGEDYDTDFGDDPQHYERTCCICLITYTPGCRVMTGTTCPHIFHQACCMEWLQQGHDHCPYCRQEMMTAAELRAAAVAVLGARRVHEMSTSALLLIGGGGASSDDVSRNHHHHQFHNNPLAPAPLSVSSSWSLSEEDV